MSSPVPPEPSPITPLPEEENIQASKGMWRREGGRGGEGGSEEREEGGGGRREREGGVEEVRGLGYSTLSHL